MLISYKHRFIFIHVYKVAGMSIRKALEPYARFPVWIRLLRLLHLDIGRVNSKWRTLPQHVKAREARKELPEKVYNNFYKFAFVRNPWDWQVSLYHYMLQHPQHHQHELVKSIRNLDEYIDWRVCNDKKLQKDFVTDENSTLIVDFVGKYEKLEEDLHHIYQVLNVNASLPHLNRSLHRDYRSYYKTRTAEMVGEHFKEDIDFFGYSF